MRRGKAGGVSKKQSHSFELKNDFGLTLFQMLIKLP